MNSVTSTLRFSARCATSRSKQFLINISISNANVRQNFCRRNASSKQYITAVLFIYENKIHIKLTFKMKWLLKGRSLV